MNIQEVKKENPAIFPELRLATLKVYAEDWARKWSIIQRIQLFHYAPVNPDHEKTKNFTTVYALLFDIDGNQADSKKFVNLTRYNDTTIREACNIRLPDQHQDSYDIVYPKFMNVVFANIYKQKPPKNYQNEWLLVPKQPQKRGKGHSRKEKRPQREPFHFESNPSWLLFDRRVEPTTTFAVLETDQEDIPNSKTDIPIPQGQIDPEEFIRSLSIAYENDTEIKIKTRTQRLKTYSFADLGFRKESSKAWRALIDILKSPDHSYRLGVAHGAKKVRNKPYDANRAILREIKKKFISFLNKTYKQQLPDTFQIFELFKNGPPGIYKLKFVVSDSGTKGSEYESFTKDELLTKIEELCERKDSLETNGEEYSEKQLFEITDKLQAAVLMAIKKGWLEQNRARYYLNPPKESIIPDIEVPHRKKKPRLEDY